MATTAPATMTARQVVMMTPADKRAIIKRARDHGQTPSEWIRRAAREYEPGDAVDEALLELLLAEIEKTTEAVRRNAAEMKADAKFHRSEMTRIRAEGWKGDA